MLRIALASALVLLAGCHTEAPTPPASNAIPFDIEGRLSFVRDGRTLKTIDIEIADTDSTRMRGLMERPRIPADTGMLFVFDHAAAQAFWMESTPKSLDIQFYGPDSTLLNIAENATPFSRESLPSSGPSQFVLEVPAGYSRRIGLVPGDRITWTQTAPRGAADAGAAEAR